MNTGPTKKQNWETNCKTFNTLICKNMLITYKKYTEQGVHINRASGEKDRQTSFACSLVVLRFIIINKICNEECTNKTNSFIQVYNESIYSTLGTKWV